MVQATDDTRGDGDQWIATERARFTPEESRRARHLLEAMAVILEVVDATEDPFDLMSYWTSFRLLNEQMQAMIPRGVGGGRYG